ncbi:hypothetical protein H4Q26_009860 [Puccinia striiformis f. sp. tritici PST-130]|nr:hypothetical protein H4Q26_009860 [Puccinia striiformis f. sp. tritici PST-130]
MRTSFHSGALLKAGRQPRWKPLRPVGLSLRSANRTTENRRRTNYNGMLSQAALVNIAVLPRHPRKGSFSIYATLSTRDLSFHRFHTPQSTTLRISSHWSVIQSEATRLSLNPQRRSRYTYQPLRSVSFQLLTQSNESQEESRQPVFDFIPLASQLLSPNLVIHHGHVLACPRGITLPYSSLFNVTLRGQSERPANDSEDESNSYTEKQLKIHQDFPRLTTKFRRLAFKAFNLNPESTDRKQNIVTSTEVISRQTRPQGPGQCGSDENHGTSIFKSWKYKSSTTKRQMKKMVVVMKNRISASSPPEQQPKTWQEYNTLYANEQIDVINPPLPPMESNEDGEAVTELPFEYYVAPQPPNEAVRQEAVRPDPGGCGEDIARLEIGDKLISEGKVPSSLEQHWEGHGSIANDGSSSNIEETRAMIGDVRSGRLPPETLEQHPIFRTSSNEVILDEDRQVFLAESGMNEAGLEVSGNPMVTGFGVRFYAGVPLMAPNMDGSQEAEENACPIGTLCIADQKPRESFSIEDQKKLVYLSEYARRELKNVWDVELKRVSRPPSENEESLESEVLAAVLSPPLPNVTSCSSAGPQSPTKSSPSLFEDHNAAVRPKMRKVFDLATKLVAETLDLSLVYLMAVVPHGESTDLGRTMIISGHNIPLPVPELDAGLHLRVLRAGEGGLLYQNPSMEECQEAALQPKIASNGHADPYASAILLAVGAEINPNVGGFVLAGYTNDHRRVFGEEDVSFMKQFANQLSTYTSRVPLS